MKTIVVEPTVSKEGKQYRIIETLDVYRISNEDELPVYTDIAEVKVQVLASVMFFKFWVTIKSFEVDDENDINWCKFRAKELFDFIIKPDDEF